MLRALTPRPHWVLGLAFIVGIFLSGGQAMAVDGLTTIPSDFAA